MCCSCTGVVSVPRATVRHQAAGSRGSTSASSVLKARLKGGGAGGMPLARPGRGPGHPQIPGLWPRHHPLSLTRTPALGGGSAQSPRDPHLVPSCPVRSCLQVLGGETFGVCHSAPSSVSWMETWSFSLVNTQVLGVQPKCAHLGLNLSRELFVPCRDHCGCSMCRVLPAAH